MAQMATSVTSVVLVLVVMDGCMMVVLGVVVFERDGSGDNWGGGAVVVTAVV